MEKKVNWVFVLLFGTFFGLEQAAVEAFKIIKNLHPEKFPLGWGSYIFMEEFIEGFIPALIGGLIANLIYRFVTKKRIKNNIQVGCGEIWVTWISANTFYIAMTLLGAWIHVVLGIDDVKWWHLIEFVKVIFNL